LAFRWKLLGKAIEDEVKIQFTGNGDIKLWHGSKGAWVRADLRSRRKDGACPHLILTHASHGHVRDRMSGYDRRASALPCPVSDPGTHDLPDQQLTGRDAAGRVRRHEGLRRHLGYPRRTCLGRTMVDAGVRGGR